MFSGTPANCQTVVGTTFMASVAQFIGRDVNTNKEHILYGNVYTFKPDTACKAKRTGL